MTEDQGDVELQLFLEARGGFSEGASLTKDISPCSPFVFSPEQEQLSGPLSFFPR